MDRIRNEVHYSGRVQGVGFRFTTSTIAKRHAVTGFVENLADGRVRLVVEGEADAIRDFLTDVETTILNNIRGADRVKLPATDEFSTFEIRRATRL